MSIRGLAGVTPVDVVLPPGPVQAASKARGTKSKTVKILLIITSTLPTPKYIRGYLRRKLAVDNGFELTNSRLPALN
jgi:hypothetical protein